MADGRVMIAATGSGSGKTVITCGLMRILKEEGSKVTPYKCGPDYIDPMYHRIALGMDVQALSPEGEVAAGGNLDTFFNDKEIILSLMNEGGFASSDYAVIEGVMGLYDGLGGTGITGSSYELARVTETPIILVVDAKGMGRSILALIKGFLSYDEHKLIRGVILNRVSGMYYEKLKSIIESELSVSVAGYVPEDERLHVGSRHLGLFTPSSGVSFRERISELIGTAAGILRETLDMAKIRAIMSSAKKIQMPADTGPLPGLPFLKDKKIGKMAVAVDEAFCFYYRENLRYLKSLGMELIPFSPLHDDRLPEGTDGILLGGGYPEEYLKELSENSPMKNAIKRAADTGVYIIAECGGFMYLQEVIEDKEGTAYRMTGVLPGTCSWRGKLTRFGYVEIPVGNRIIRGHEFHYYDSDRNGEDIMVIKASTGKGYPAMYHRENMLAGFPHLYYPSAGKMVL